MLLISSKNTKVAPLYRTNTYDKNEILFSSTFFIFNKICVDRHRDNEIIVYSESNTINGVRITTF